MIWFILLFLLATSFCTPPSSETSLVKRVERLGSGISAPHSGSYMAGSKALRAIVQDKSGTASFYHHLPAKAVLRYKLISPSHASARVSIESDYPTKLYRGFSVSNNGPDSLSLDEFANRVVRISLEADFQSDSSQPLYWINPVIQDLTQQNIAESPELRSFRARHRRDNVLLVVFDAAAASHLSCYGYPRKTTPHVDALAGQGVLFEHAISQAPFTTASTATLLTGLYPLTHGVGIDIDRLDDSYQTLAESFAHAGYETALFSGNPNASPLIGIGQGFRKIWTHNESTPSRAEDFVPEVTSWLSQIKGKSFFAYLHFREPHAPYVPPKQFLKQFPPQGLLLPHYERLTKWGRVMMAAYDANLAYVDAQFARIIKVLQSFRVWDRTIVIVLSDHGEAFREHGFRGHSRAVYDELIRIPLVIRFPNEPKLTRIRRSDLAGTLDVAPTLLHLLGAAKIASSDGRSLLPLIVTGSAEDGRRLISQSRWMTYSLRSSEFKLISQLKKDVPDRFYWITKDPYEQRNIISDFPILGRFYRLELENQLEQLKRAGKAMPRPAKGSTVMDKETKEQLRALGYVDN